MSFLSRLFKKNTPETLEAKITKVELQPQEQLLNTALQSEEEQLRVAAIAKLNYSPDLVKIATSNQQPKQIINIARKRIGELLDSADVSLESLSKDVSDQSTLLSLCSYSDKAGTTLIDQLSDEKILLDVAQSAATTSLRQAAAQKLHSRPILTEILKSAKNKDKSVLKIAKRKLDVFKETDAKNSEIRSKIDVICKQAEQLVKRDIDDVFHAKKKQIEIDWSAFVEMATTEAVERFQSAMASCQQMIDALLKEKQDALEQEASDKEAKKDIHSALISMQEFIARLYTHESPKDLGDELLSAQNRQESTLKEAEQRGLSVVNERRSAESLAKAAHSIMEKLKQSAPIATLIDNLNLCKDESGKVISKQIETLIVHSKSLRDVPVPEVITQAQIKVGEWSKNLQLQANQSKEKVQQTAELIRKANWAVSKGYVGRARAIFKDLEEKVQQLEHIPSHIESKFEDVKESMKKLGDWHEFAVTPKKEALVEKMQGLISSTLHPQDLADKIHDLQDKWKELCKGGQNQDESLWEQFQEASQSAYERCKTYFDQQTKAREENAERRLALLTHLEQYEAEYKWDQANWKEVEDTLRASRETWQSYWPIPRKQIKELQERFDGILDRIFSLRNDEFENNKVKKQNIVEQSITLASSEDIQKSIETAKQLQAQWKLIGRCKRKDDQSLWKDFRENCDTVFEKRNQVTQALIVEQKQALSEAEAILGKLQLILDCESSAFFEAKNECAELTEQFRSIGELPRDSYQRINKLFAQSIESIEARVDDVRKSTSMQQWVSVFNIANSIRGYELKCIKGEPVAELKSEIEALIAGTVKWPSGTLATLQGRLDNASSLNSTEDGDDQLRTLCIRSEIITHNDTPESEKAYRMAYQVNQLKDSFGSTNPSSHNTKNEMLTEWMTIAAVSEEQYSALLQRFSKCWELNL